MTATQHHPHSSDLARRIAERGTILRVQVGSGVHGTSITGQDDRDEMGLCLEPAEFVTGVAQVPAKDGDEPSWIPFEQYEYHSAWERAGGLANRSGAGDLDVIVYSARKWTRLALAGNPTVLLPLFVPEAEIVAVTEAGHELRANAHRIASKRACERFLGYMVSQRRAMTGEVGAHTNRPELVAQFGYDCYSDDTEFLTRSGWRTFDEIGDDEAVATIDVAGAVEFQIPTSRIAKAFHGAMIRMRHRYTEALVTPTHRMFVSRVDRGPSGVEGTRYRPEIADWHFLPAAQLTSGHYHVRVAGTPRTAEVDISDSSLVLYGAYLSEGCVAKRAKGKPSVLAFTQVIGGRLEPHLSRIAADHPVRQFRYEPRQGRQPHTITTLANRDVATQVAEDCGEGSWNKHLPPWAFDLSARQADVLLDAMLAGDGTRTRTNYWVYYTVSERLAGDVQALAITAGRRANVWGPYAPAGIYQVMIQDRGRTVEAMSPRLNLHPEAPTTQRVVCFAVPNETLVTRRNGRVAMQGNCKFAMHALRLGLQGVEYLQTGRITLPIPEPHLTALREVRQGQWELAPVLEWARRLEDELGELAETSPLPEHPDLDWVNGWLHRAHTSYWAG